MEKSKFTIQHTNSFFQLTKEEEGMEEGERDGVVVVDEEAERVREERENKRKKDMKIERIRKINVY